ncbi:MAG TPA: MFS transporter [Streptosporangiaceae bacterium]|jgi:MFS family permease
MSSDQTVQTPGSGAGLTEPAPDSIFANHDFLKLWAGETVSLIGTQVTQFALPLVAVITLRATVFEVGLLNALKFVPVIVFSLFAGVWLDRRRRRPVMIAAALGNVLLIGLVPIASAAGVLSIGLLYVVVALAGSLGMVFDIGALSYVPSLVEPRHLSDANSKIQAIRAFAGIAGPGLAGLLVGLITAPITLSVDAVSYLFSAAGLISIRKPEPELERPEQRPSVWSSLGEGLHAVYGNRLLFGLLTQGAATNLFFGVFTTVFVVYAIRDLHMTPFTLGLVVGAAAAGSLAGALSGGRVRKWLGFRRTMIITTIGECAAPLILLIPRHPTAPLVILMIAAQLFYGLCLTIDNVIVITVRQVVTPKQVLARMNAAYRMLLFGVAPIGMFLGGVLGSVFGVWTALVIACVTMCVPIAWIFFAPVFRLSEMPEAPQTC